MNVSRHFKERSIIYELSKDIVHEKDVRTSIDRLLHALTEQLDMKRPVLTLRYGDELVIEASHGLDANACKLGRYHMGEGIIGHVAKTGRPYIVPDIRKDKRFLNRTCTRHTSEALAFICVPLYHQGSVIGTLSADRKIEDGRGENIGSEPNLEHDTSFLEMAGNIAANAAFQLLREREEQKALLKEKDNTPHRPSNDIKGIVGQCREMRLIGEQIRLVAPSDATVLIRGASGTGKELVAKAIVAQSSRKTNPFISLNCAALPEDLVESELFGHEKGAFTGAVSRRVGRAEEADGGTLFLDEIGDLSLQVQVKLLRFLQERTFSRVGSNHELHSDVRFLAATSRDLEQLMKEGKFREDLYYRLNIFPIFVPKLSQRKDDILLLADHFIHRMNMKYHKNIKGISTPAKDALMNWHWPGNVRELENCIERAVLTAGDTTLIRSWHLPTELKHEEKNKSGDDTATHNVRPSSVSGDTATVPLSEKLRLYEREVLIGALRRHKGNLSAVGRELGISPRMMTYRVSRLGISRKEFT